MTTQQEYGDDIAEAVEKIRLQEIADQQAATEKSTSEQTAATTTEASTEGQGATSATGTTEGEGSTAAPAPADQQGDVRGALRASRRAERQARDRATQLEAELEAAKKLIPAPADESVTDAELAELEADAPLYAKALKEVRAAKAATPPAAAPAPQAQPEFIPPVQQPHIQDAIDEIPDLLAMQNDPDQTAFVLADKTDALLRTLPAWKDKPLPERLAECARRVKADLGTAAPAPAPQPPASPAPARRTAAAAVAEAPRAQPSTLSDIAGGAAPATEGPPDLKRIMQMSDEEIAQMLERHG